MLGRRKAMDMAPGASGQIGYDARAKFGAGTLYDGSVARAYAYTPEEGTAVPLRSVEEYGVPTQFRWRTTRSSNKESEHFTGNMPVRIVVAQLAPMTQARNLNNLLSKRLVLSPASQSLGRT